MTKEARKKENNDLSNGFNNNNNISENKNSSNKKLSYEFSKFEFDNNKEILLRVDKEYEFLRKKYSLKPTLKELDKYFAIIEIFFREKFIGNRLLRVISFRIIDNFLSLNSYLHSLVMPNPANMMNTAETNLLDENDKKIILNVMNKLVRFSSDNMLVSYYQLLDKQIFIINNAIDVWLEILEVLKPIFFKINNYWVRESGL